MATFWQGNGNILNYTSYAGSTLSGFSSSGGAPLDGITLYNGNNTLTVGDTVSFISIPTNMTPVTGIYLGSVVNGDQVLPTIALSGGGYVILGIADPANQPSTWDVGLDPLCFLRGTRIDTPQGPIAVEDLAIGDTVMTASQGVASIQWIGRQRRNPRLCADDLPIRIAAGALGDGLPLRDLYVSPTHALGVEGCLVHAAALVNGRTIHQVSEWSGDIDYFHIETERHELIIAEGAPAETLFDNGLRDHFDNHADYAERYPNPEPVAELDLPRICYPRQLPQAIRRKLDAIADALWGQASRAA
jgi:hypothetical protein